MPRRVDVFDGVVSDIRVAVKGLRITRRGDDRIGGDEAGEVRIIVSRAIVVEAGFGKVYSARKMSHSPH
jgi:hypothetical protein